MDEGGGVRVADFGLSRGLDDDNDSEDDSEDEEPSRQPRLPWG